MLVVLVVVGVHLLSLAHARRRGRRRRRHDRALAGVHRTGPGTGPRGGRARVVVVVGTSQLFVEFPGR